MNVTEHLFVFMVWLQKEKFLPYFWASVENVVKYKK